MIVLLGSAAANAATVTALHGGGGGASTRTPLVQRRIVSHLIFWPIALLVAAGPAAWFYRVGWPMLLDWLNGNGFPPG